MKRLILSLLFLPLVAGCPAVTPSTPAYKLANQARLKAVEPWLRTYSADHASDAVKVSDQLQAWHAEVDAQQRTVTPAPAQP